MTDNQKLQNLKGQIFKILYLKEEDNPTINSYIDSLYIQIKGMEADSENLATNKRFNSIINVIAYFKTSEFNLGQCKREVFKCINTIDAISRELDNG